MALPSAECFKGLDQRDQLTAIYEAALELETGGGGEFDPNSIAGLILWVDGDHVIEDGGIVSEMTDRSTGGHTILSVIDSVTQGIRNGHGTVVFNGSQQFTVTPHINTAAGTIFVVGAIDASGSATYAPLFISQNNRMCAKTGSSGGAWGTFTSGGDLNGTTTLADGVWHCEEMTSAGGGIGTRMVMDGVQEASSANASTGTSATSFGNEEGFLRTLVGAIAEILYYDSVLSVLDRDAVRNYLRTKYNLP